MSSDKTASDRGRALPVLALQGRELTAFVEPCPQRAASRSWTPHGHGRLTCAASAALTLLLMTRPVAAQAVPTKVPATETERELDAEPASTHEAAPCCKLRRVWPIPSAVLVGPLVHGVGHLVGGERRTGLRLLAAEGVGIAAVVAGLAGLALTGASEKTALPFIGLTGAGVGLFSTSFLADLYGVAARPGGFGTPVSRPALVLEAGPHYVSDPIFPYRGFADLAGRAFFGPHFLRLRCDLGLDHDNQRVRALYGLRLAEWDAATYAELELGGVYHRYGAERFSMSFGEAAFGGRFSLQHLGPSLRGAFVEGALGIALGAHRYFGIETEFDSMTLLRLGFGIFIGDGGEWRLYYDHRHDDFAAGMKLAGLGSGVIGHVGSELTHYLDEDWGLSLRVETGSATVFGLSAVYRRKRL